VDETYLVPEKLGEKSAMKYQIGRMVSHKAAVSLNKIIAN
jgi:hypothetical protein